MNMWSVCFDTTPILIGAQVPEEFRAEFGQSYARSDLSGGAGLDQAHKRNQGPNDFRRFFDSKGVDVFINADDKEQSYSLQLHYETSLNKSSSNVNQNVLTHEDINAHLKALR